MVGDLQVAVVDEPLRVLGHPTAHAVVGHGYRVSAEGPKNGPILAVVGDLPDTGHGFHQSLIAVSVEGGDELGRLGHRRRLGQYFGVLVQGIRRIGCIGARFGGGLTVTDIIEAVGEFIVTINLCFRIGEFVAHIVTVVDSVGIGESAARFRNGDTARSRIISVVVLRNHIGRGRILNLQQIAAIVINPGRGEPVRVRER